MFSDTDHLGGKMTKSAIAVPGFNEGQVRTVNIEGSLKSKVKLLVLHVLKRQFQ